MLDDARNIGWLARQTMVDRARFAPACRRLAPGLSYGRRGRPSCRCLAPDGRPDCQDLRSARQGITGRSFSLPAG
jgi:hypothetical protein